jgi:hypothetical protein
MSISCKEGLHAPPGAGARNRPLGFLAPVPAQEYNCGRPSTRGVPRLNFLCIAVESVRWSP